MDLLKALARLVRRGPPTPSLAGLDPAHTRLVVGLGNPGPEYADTRHNVGFRTLDLLAKRYAAVWQDRTSDLESLVALVQPSEALKVVLAKPQTFMNRSGRAVHEVIGFLAIDTDSCLVVYDDMDLAFGTLRLRERGSPGTHNGMRSVVSTLHTQSVPRLRIGISQATPGDATSHVLSEFTADEQPAVEALIERAAEAVITWALEGPATAMNRYNSSKV